MVSMGEFKRVTNERNALQARVEELEQELRLNQKPIVGDVVVGDDETTEEV